MTSKCLHALTFSIFKLSLVIKLMVIGCIKIRQDKTLTEHVLSSKKVFIKVSEKLFRSQLK